MNSCNLFQGFTDEDFKELEKVLQEKNLAPGETLFKEEEKSDGFYIIVEGTVEILKKVDDKNELITTLSKGQPIGEMSILFPDEKRSATIRSEGKSELLFFSLEHFHQLKSENHPTISKMILSFARVLAQRLEHMNEEILKVIDKIHEEPKDFPKDIKEFKNVIAQWRT